MKQNEFDNRPRTQGDARPEDKKDQNRERKIDEQLDQSFPASDPPSYSTPGNSLDEDLQGHNADQRRDDS